MWAREMSAPENPLDGITVVALEQAVAAPFATRLLADAGARVIKIERPEGDFARNYDIAANGISSYFAWLNRGKESIALDLKQEGEREFLDGIISQCDVFIQNLGPGSSDRLGFGEAQLRARDPRLICCDISGYGTSGTYSAMKAYDLLVQAESGLLSISGPPGMLGRIGVSVVDIATGQSAALAISQALLRQARDSVGASIELSLFSTIAEWMTVPLLHHDYLGAAPERIGLAHPSIAPYGAFETKDGQSILISVQTDTEWQVLCSHILGCPEMGTDTRFANNLERVAHRAETDRVVGDGIRRVTLDRLRQLLLEHRIAFGVVNDVEDLSNHPQIRRISVAHEMGTAEMPAPSFLADWEQSLQVPALDAHGVALRAEFG